MIQASKLIYLVPPGAGKKPVAPGMGSKNPNYMNKRLQHMYSLADESVKNDYYPNIFEKFSDESDPMKDMEIGMVDCPLCQGKGYFVSFFNNENKECKKCHGNKKITYEEYKEFNRMRMKPSFHDDSGSM